MTKFTFTRERPKFGHNPAREGNEVWAIDENMGTNLQAFYNHFYIGCLNTKQQHFENNFFFSFFFNSGRALYNRAGRKTVQAGRSTLRNMPSWNTVREAATL